LIRSETQGRIARIELHRPEKKNALTAEGYGQLADALNAADANGAVRAILIHGQPDCFTAGNDLTDFLERPPHGENATTWNFLRTLPRVAKPIVAAVGGPAVGIGTTLLLHCDLVYATSTARFQLPFVALGVIPEAASTLLLPMLAGYQRAAELLLLGQPFTAQKAHEVGIVTAVVPAESLMAEAEKAAHALAGLPSESIRLTKRLMKERYAEAVRQAMDEEGRIFRERLTSADAKEAMSAFLQKRKPNFE
jgi:enoyl-CoA hydratase/carnithine racemase